MTSAELCNALRRSYDLDSSTVNPQDIRLLAASRIEELEAQLDLVNSAIDSQTSHHPFPWDKPVAKQTETP